MHKRRIELERLLHRLKVYCRILPRPEKPDLIYIGVISFEWTADVLRLCWHAMLRKMGQKPVSYTHLTLPTSDLV